MSKRGFVGWALFAALAIIAAIHVYWGLGGLWPADNLRDLIDLVIGDSRFERMPPVWMTLLVAALIAFAGWIALERAEVVVCLPKWMARWGSWVLVIVFGLRGASTYFMALGIRPIPETATDAFLKWDALLYAPLCLLIAAGFLFLATRKTR